MVPCVHFQDNQINQLIKETTQSVSWASPPRWAPRAVFPTTHFGFTCVHRRCSLHVPGRSRYRFERLGFPFPLLPGSPRARLAVWGWLGDVVTGASILHTVAEAELARNLAR